jgi:hypothetical protein
LRHGVPSQSDGRQGAKPEGRKRLELVLERGVLPGMAPRVRWVHRADWGARPWSGLTQRPIRDVSGATFHHTTGATLRESDRLDDWVREIQRYHQLVKQPHYADIAYNALIAWDGSIFEGRPLWAVGAHARSTTNLANRTRWGVAYLGLGDELTDAAAYAFRSWVYVATMKAGRHLSIDTHESWASRGGTRTECPGAGKLHALAHELDAVGR